MRIGLGGGAIEWDRVARAARIESNQIKLAPGKTGEDCGLELAFLLTWPRSWDGCIDLRQ